MRTTAILAMVVLSLSAASHAAEVNCALEVAPIQPKRPDAYVRAALTITHDLEVPILAAALRAQSGGPWILVDMTAPPGAPTRRPVRLPATELAQTYIIRCFTDYSGDWDTLPEPAAEVRASIRWPQELVADRDIISQNGYEAFGETTDGWPNEFRLQVLIALATMTLLGGFALLPRRRVLRVGGAVLVAASAAAAISWMMCTIAPPAVSQRTFRVIHHGPTGTPRIETLTAVRARKATQASIRLPGPSWCVYADRGHMADDATLVTAADGVLAGDTLVRFALERGETRLFAGRARIGAGETRPLRIPVTFDPTGDEWVVKPRREIPQAVWIHGNRVASIDATAAGSVRRISLDQTRLVDHLYGHGEAYGFNARTIELLRWWDTVYRDVSQSYLVWRRQSADGDELHVAKLIVTEP